MHRQYTMLQIKIWVVIVILFYDAFLHGTPLYYMGFYFAGRLLGKMFAFTQDVYFTVGTRTFSLKSHPIHFALIALLVSARFIWGEAVLEGYNIVFVTDALALLFLGLNHTRLKSMIKQIDRLVYGKVASVTSEINKEGDNEDLAIQGKIRNDDNKKPE